MKKLLLHSCCAPCSTIALKRLSSLYDITVYYYNPNIEPLEEYEKRKNEQIKLLEILNIKYLDGDYNNRLYHEKIHNYETLGEGSKRCYHCYQFRLENTIIKAQELNFDLFSTTLTVSPYKNASWVFEIASNLEQIYHIPFLKINFSENNGYQESINLSHQYKLYRQKYCGCLQSKNN